jgi:2-oxo-4-hydroxy-4-carboxy-5-ureidoimidazoline decarboxylase
MSDAERVPLAQLNEMARPEFVAALGEVFEHASWLADAAAAHRPFATVTELHAAMLAALVAAPVETVTRLLNNHPDLAGSAARAEPLTVHSAREQAGAGLDRLSDEETARLAQWNARYRARFGFPLIICALRHSKDSIFAEFQRRLAGEPATERDAALDEIARISALRLARTIVGPGMLKVHGEVSTHLLDTMQGGAAAGVAIELYAISSDGAAALVASAISNTAGRTDRPLIAGRPVPNGTWELRFAVGTYLAERGTARFLDVVPVRFTTHEPEGHYHIPLLFTPWSYTTYRGG